MKIKINSKNIILSLIASAMLIGCGGEDTGSVVSTDAGSEVAVEKIGTLSDSRIGGITYTCGSTTGLTDADGYFTYTSDCSNVEFSIGDIKLGSINTGNINGDATVYPADLLGLDRNETNGTVLVNMLQVLQSLDSDGNPNNGITIDSNTTIALTGISEVNLDSNETQSSDLTAIVVASANKTLIDRDYAIAHYEDTLRQDLNISVDTVAPAPALYAILPNITKEDNTSVVINGEVGAKIFIGGNDTGIIIDENNTATVYLNTSGADGNITSIITLEDDLSQTSDDFNAIIEKDATIPSFSISNLNIDENVLSLTDINAADVHDVSYSLSGTDVASFDINASTGVITFKNLPNYEIKTSYDLNISATDTVGNINNQNISIGINPLNDIAPVLTSATSKNVGENFVG
ncbi:MAG: hypothetical protein KAJ49_07140, partial [Arcobacteraceae bacterium]|nr:hypothetical protein [Arcobacteraceae bacterium]